MIFGKANIIIDAGGCMHPPASMMILSRSIDTVVNTISVTAKAAAGNACNAVLQIQSALVTECICDLGIISSDNT
jgi:hypothetical protein